MTERFSPLKLFNTLKETAGSFYGTVTALSTPSSTVNEYP
jgi:hypothetical protein